FASRRLARRGRRHVLRLHARATVEAHFDRVLETVLARRARPAVSKPAGGDGVVRAPEYARLVARVQKVVESEVPQDAEVLVATPDGRWCSGSTLPGSRTRPSTSPRTSPGRAISRCASVGSRSAMTPPTGSSER